MTRGGSDAGDRTPADRLFAEAADGRPGPQLSRLLARLAVRTGLPARDHDLFAGLLTGVFAEGQWSVDAVLPVLDAEALAAVPAAAATAAGDRHDRVVVAVARFAEQTGDLDLLGAMLDVVPNAQSAWLAAGRAAMALARRGELRDAVDVAHRCGLAAPG